MKAVITIAGHAYTINLNHPMPIGIPLNPFDANPLCFHAENPHAAPMEFNGFSCNIASGAPVNFYTLQLTPHGNGTHTECIGHISSDFEKINDVKIEQFCTAELITIEPEQIDKDAVITEKFLAEAIQHKTTALIIRTLPNSEVKKKHNHTGTNPAYFSVEAMNYIVQRGYSHLLIDLPSVDREQDDGKVLAHKIFWGFNADPQPQKTITELIFVPDEIIDGLYLLNLQISNISLDAAPSNPIIYKPINSKK